MECFRGILGDPTPSPGRPLEQSLRITKSGCLHPSAATAFRDPLPVPVAVLLALLQGPPASLCPWGKKSPRFLSLSLLALCDYSSSWHCTVLGKIHGFHPLDGGSTRPPVVTEMSPRGQSWLCLKTTGLDCPRQEFIKHVRAFRSPGDALGSTNTWPKETLISPPLNTD